MSAAGNRRRRHATASAAPGVLTGNRGMPAEQPASAQRDRASVTHEAQSRMVDARNVDRWLMFGTASSAACVRAAPRARPVLFGSVRGRMEPREMRDPAVEVSALRVVDHRNERDDRAAFPGPGIGPAASVRGDRRDGMGDHDCRRRDGAQSRRRVRRRAGRADARGAPDDRGNLGRTALRPEPDRPRSRSCRVSSNPTGPAKAQAPLTRWTWKSVPRPALASLPPRAQAWETTRYRAYQAQLAGHTIGETFERAAAFLDLTAAKATPVPDNSGHAAR